MISMPMPNKCGIGLFLCAEHVRQLGGEALASVESRSSPLHNLMEVKC